MNLILSNHSNHMVDKNEQNVGRIKLGGGQMIFQESETVELKAIVVEDIKKEIIAFANCEGGKLYIGRWMLMTSVCSSKKERARTPIIVFLIIFFPKGI